MDPLLAQLLGDAVLATVIAFALKIVWGKYQEALKDNKTLMEEQTREWKRLAGLEESNDPEAPE